MTDPIWSPTFTPSTTSSASDPGVIDPIYGLGNLQTQLLYLGNEPQQRGMGSVGRGAPSRPDPRQVPQSETALKYMQQFAQQSATDPAGFTDLQVQLYEAGFYGSTKPRFGVYTTDDATALKQAIQSYAGINNADNPTPITFSDYLNRAMAQVQKNGGNGSARAPVQLTDPDELNQTLQSAAQQALGRNLAPDELSAFVSAFHGKEKAAYNAEGPGSAVTEPDVSGEALTDVDDNHGAEEQQRKQATYLDAINSMLGVK